MNCNIWFENYVKTDLLVLPKQAYAAGKAEGFSRDEIKKARKWLGKYIITQTEDGITFWRWNM